MGEAAWNDHVWGPSTLGHGTRQCKNCLCTYEEAFYVLGMTCKSVPVPVVKPGPEPVAVRHSFDGYGWKYMDSGSGSDWLKRAMTFPDAEPLFEKGT